MPPTQLPAVLDEITSLTSIRDSTALESSLAQTLLALSHVKNTTIYSAGTITRAKHAIATNQKISEYEKIPTDIAESLFECLDTGKVSTAVLKGNKKLTLFPLLCSKKKPIAVIVVEETHEESNHDLTMQILAIYHNFMSLIHENERDTLTGLLNRKTFDLNINNIISSLANELKNGQDESQNSTYLAIFDLDHFKQINDTYGHLMGDEVLLLFSQQMSKNFRDSDALFRFGGEEFVGIFQSADDDTIKHILNRFRKTIEQFSFPQVGQITFSCGFTRISAWDISSKIIDRADIALYHAKNNGRNQVCHYEELIQSGQVIEKEETSGEVELF